MKHGSFFSAPTTVGPIAFLVTSNKPSSRLLAGSALLFLVIAWLAAPAFAQTITGSFDGVGTLTPTNTPGVYIDNFVGDGTDDTYGAFNAMSHSTVDFRNPPLILITNGVLSEVFMDGTLFGTGSGSGTANGHGMATFMIDFVITGGTGVFEHLHGNAMITGTITQTSPLTEAVDATYTGNLVTPEPSSLSLLLLGAGFGYRLVDRKRWI